jgi:hypothetical protein
VSDNKKSDAAFKAVETVKKRIEAGELPKDFFTQRAKKGADKAARLKKEAEITQI